MQTKQRGQSQKSMEKSIIYGLMDEERSSFRKGFVRYLYSKYNINPSTSYAKLKQGRFRRWELMGIIACVAEYDRFKKPKTSCTIMDDYAGFVPAIALSLELREQLDNQETGGIALYYKSLKNKSDFIQYMKKYEIGAETMRRKCTGALGTCFSEVEMKGWENIYREYLALGGATL